MFLVRVHTYYTITITVNSFLYTENIQNSDQGERQDHFMISFKVHYIYSLNSQALAT